ncbi:MAG: response regulator [Myxococcales bacterium]|nr:response regulator [Myxococcales bacterium]
MSAPILIVDDNDDNRKLLAWVLEDADLDYDEADSAEDALEKLRTSAHRAVLMDISLPGMQGDEAIEVIRRDPALSKLPVVAVTAHALKGDTERIRARGADAVLTKPVDEERLIEVLMALIGES